MCRSTSVVDILRRLSKGKDALSRRGVGDQSVQITGKPLGNDFRYFQFRRKQSDDFIAWRSANEDFSGPYRQKAD